MPPRVVLVSPGDPYAVETLSGISVGLVESLRSHGALAGAVNGRPNWLRRVEQVASFDRGRNQWRQTFNSGTSRVGPLLREATSGIARRRTKPVAERVDADAVLQLTGWYRPTVDGVLNASYHDGNLASFLRQPELAIDPGTRQVRKALEWERGLYDATDLIFTMSAWLREIFIEAFEQSPGKVVVAGAGSDLAEATGEIERDWETPRYLFVGREWVRKGGPELLRAWPAVRAAKPDAQLSIVGPRELPEPLPDGVVLIGRIDRSDAAGQRAYTDLYREATAFVLPSLYEPFGIVLLEAMAFGLPCIAADRCAMPEIVEDGTTGRVADPTDSDALAAALLEVSEPATARRMGESGRRRLEEDFTWDAVADRILTEIEARTAPAA